MHALEGYSSHFVCLSVADLEDGGLLVLQRDMNIFFNSALFLRKSEKTGRSSTH